MIEIIEKICAFATKEVADMSDLDKYTALQEVAKRLQDEADVYLRLEYMLIEEDDE